ncbi:MAG TPA: RagB/SusD family nutrient uptake outer membrane protein [Chitinophagaceae bacterium]|jgi:hypothetical protein
MRIQIKYTLVLALCAVMFSSCRRELLTPIPQTSVSDASAFSTTARVSSGVLSLYMDLKSGNFYGGRFVIYGDIKADEFLNLTSNLITSSDVWNENPTNSTTAITNLWASAYTTINACNVFIDGMNKTGTTVVGATLGANYIAEAKLIRALAYLSLVQFYARPYADGNGAKPGLPLRITPIVGPGSSLLVRSTVAQIYTQILADLNDAEAGLPLSYSSAYNNTTRAHRNTAIALKTRVYLTMQDYANTITEGNKIVTAAAPFKATTGVPDSLQPNITTVFKTPYTSTESILSMPMTTTTGDYPGTQNQLGYYYYQQSAIGTAEYSLNPNGIIANVGWLASDARRGYIYGTVTKYMSKYATPSPYTDYVPVIRYSEVMLNLAEAIARKTNSIDPQAVALLNAVRHRSDAATTFTAGSFATATDLINAILTERRIEFLGEGLRNNDLMRLLQTIPAKGTAPAKAPTDVGYIWPISSSELSLNTLCTDN